MNHYILYDREIILKENGNLPDEQDFTKIKKKCENRECFEESCYEMKVLGLKSKENLPNGYKILQLREYYANHSEEENFTAFRAKGLLEWRANTKFCEACGSSLQEKYFPSVKECSKCKKEYYPHLSPCIIVAIQKEGKVLLARHTYRNQDIFACIAGFMESGESAEHAVQREIFEETGLKVKNITYRGSQSWPFPQQLMLGFTAEYESGEIRLQQEEIAEVEWFDPKNIPAGPKQGSIAYKLIHDFC